MQRPLKYFESPRLTAGIMSGLLGCTVVSFLVPQRELVGDATYAAWVRDTGFAATLAEILGLERVFSSWLFIGLVSALAVNLVACTWNRIGRRWRRRVAALRPPAAAHLVTPPPDLDLGAALTAEFTGWKRHVPGPDQWLFERGQYGWWGSMLLHAGILLLLIAGLVSALTRFSGVMVITEGQTVVDQRDSYLSVSQSPSMGSAFTGDRIGLTRMDFTYEGDTIVDAVATMVRDDGSVDRARVNQPLRSSGKTYLLSDPGFAVGLRVARDGETLADAYVNLGTPEPAGYSDEIELADGTKLKLVAVPDRKIAPGQRSRQRMLLKDPAVWVRLLPSVESTRVVPGQTVRIGELNVTIIDVRRWNRFNVRSDRGLPLVYVAFALALLGAAIRWLDPDMRIACVRGDDGARVWATARANRERAELLVRRASRALTGEEA